VSARRLWLLLPAYDEAGNLGPLLDDVREVARTWPAPSPPLTVVVVDDGSRDDTVAIARAPRPGLDVTVLEHVVNQNLGAAMRTGIEHVLARAGPDDVLFAMDADHTHPPEAMPAMLARIDAGAGIVIASRFQPGAEVHGLTFVRKLVSWLASGLLQVLFPGARDYTCGYRAYRVDLLRWGAARYGDDFLNQRGFSVMVDLLLKLRRKARRIDEVPLILRYDRKQGASKMKLVRTAITTLRLLGRRLVGNPKGPDAPPPRLPLQSPAS
jgi:dolichol-phosphate mannosyltransferase